jgi:hypothetical protein
MPRKSFTPEQSIAKLRQIEVLISQGHSVAGGRHLGAELLPLAYGGMGVRVALTYADFI